MTPENFTYWLQGFFEVQNPSILGEVQTQIIKDHLALVFKKETPNRFSAQSPNFDSFDGLPKLCNYMTPTGDDAGLPILYFGSEKSISIDHIPITC